MGFVQVLITQWQYVAVTDLSNSVASEMCRNLGFDGLNSMTMMPAYVTHFCIDLCTVCMFTSPPYRFMHCLHVYHPTVEYIEVVHMLVFYFPLSVV